MIIQFIFLRRWTKFRLENLLNAVQDVNAKKAMVCDQAK